LDPPNDMRALDGPGMGYGPAARADRRGIPVVTVVLALVCLLLAVTLAALLLRPARPPLRRRWSP
jgi:hypothetical protein